MDAHFCSPFSRLSIEQVIRIPDGLHDIATLIGIDPKRSIFDYNVTAKNEKRPEISRGMVQQGAACLARGDATAITLWNHPELRDYWATHAGVRNIVETTRHAEPGEDFSFPHGDVYQRLHRAEKEVTTRVNGKIFVPHTSTSETEHVAHSLGAQLLMSPDQSRLFNSKVRTATQADQYNYVVSPHIIVRDREGVKEGFGRIRDVAMTSGLDPSRTRYWIRFDRLSAGVGVMPFEPRHTPFAAVEDWIDHTINDVMDGEFVPLVMDLDIGQAPGVRRVLDNLNVQGVCGENGSYCVGVTQQKTSNGKYLGGELPNTSKTDQHATEAIKWGMPVMKAAQEQGYRGYAGIDVMLAEMEDGTQRGFVLEMNGRLNSSTSLLSMSHYVARESEAGRVYAGNIIHHFSPLTFEAYMAAFDRELYKGSKSEYAGILPIIFFPDASGQVVKVKTIAVAPTREKLLTLQRRVDHVTAQLN